MKTFPTVELFVYFFNNRQLKKTHFPKYTAYLAKNLPTRELPFKKVRDYYKNFENQSNVDIRSWTLGNSQAFACELPGSD